MRNVHLYFRNTVPILLFFALQCCISLKTSATTYYISPTGSDVTGLGTIIQPWQNLSFAITQSIKGDIIYFKAGTHFINVRTQVPVGISLEGVDSNTSIIKSTLSGLYIDILRFDQIAEGVDGSQHISNLQFDGRMITQRAIHIRGRSNVSIYNCKFKDFVEKGVIFEGRTDNAYEAAPILFATGNSFHHNGVYNCAGYPNGNYGSGQLNIGGQEDMLVYSNTMIQNQRTIGQNGWPIKYATGGFNKNLKIYNNILIKNKFYGDYGGDKDWDFAIELWFSLGGIEIYNNYIEGGVDLAYGEVNQVTNYSWWVHNNTIKQAVLNDKFQHGVIFERAIKGAIVENNIFDKVGCGVVINIEDFSPDRPLYQLLENVVIRKNLMMNIGRAPAGGGNGNNDGNNGFGVGVFVHNTALFDFNGLSVDNNTIVASPNQRPFVGIYFNFDAISGNPNNFNVRNNIVKDFYGEWFRTAGTNCTINGLKIQNNNPNGTGQFGNNNNPLYVGNLPTGLLYTNNITTNPLFTSTINYQLQAISPCVDAGLNIGLPYSGIAPDRGYEELYSILPVKFLDFSATENKNKNQLQWVTTNENDLQYYTIERSNNGFDFIDIGKVNFKESNVANNVYTFTDETPAAEINYYRLSIVYKDNSKEYSKVISITSKHNNSLAIISSQLSTTQKELSIKINSNKNQKANLVLFSNNGSKLCSETLILQKGVNAASKKTAALSAGTYYIKIYTTEETVVKQIMSSK
jgi:hypothetical protein